MRFVQWFAVMLLVVMCWTGGASPAGAAPFEFTPTARTAFDQMVQAANATTATELKQRYAELQTLQKQEIAWDGRIATIHYRNDERDKSLRKRIKDIDAVKIANLEKEVARAKTGYEPLFRLYDTRKTQLSLAKSAKNKTLTAYYQVQTDIAKSAVQAAKKDISAKEAALKRAKSDASAKMKTIRDMLFEAESHKSKIKTLKSQTSATRKLFTAETKLLNQAVRKKDAAASLASIKTCVSHARQIVNQKTSIHNHEAAIAAIIDKAEARLKAMS